MNVMKLIPTSVGQAVGRNILQLQKHSPRILFSAGLVGTVASTVLACKATLKLEQVLEDTQKTLVDISVLEHESYTEEDRTKDKALVYAKTIGAIMKLYGPAIAVGAVSVSCLVGSHHILSTRNAGMMAAYSALEKGFEEYRTRVRKELGEDKDREFRHGSEVVTVKDLEGKKSKVTRVGSDVPSQYARFFDETSRYWERRPELNKIFLRCQQQYANDKLIAQGHLFLNEVYDALGFERTPAGAVVGWVIRKDGDGDNYVDFGIFDNNSDRIRDFMNGNEGSVLIDPNVDGIIYNLI